MTAYGEYKCIFGNCEDGELICDCDNDVCDGECIVPYKRIRFHFMDKEDGLKHEAIVLDNADWQNW